MRWALVARLTLAFFSFPALMPQQAHSAELMDVCFEYTGTGGGSLTLNFDVSPEGIIPLNGFRTLDDGTRIPVAGSAVVAGDQAKLGLILMRASESSGTVVWEVNLTFSNGVWKGTGYYASLSGSGDGSLSGEMILVPCSSISSLSTLERKDKSTGSPEDGIRAPSANALVQ